MEASEIDARLRILEKAYAEARGRQEGEEEALRLQLEYIKGQGEHLAMAIRGVQNALGNIRSVQQSQIGRLRRDLSEVDDMARKNKSDIGWIVKIGGAIQGIGIAVAGWVWSR